MPDQSRVQKIKGQLTPRVLIVASVMLGVVLTASVLVAGRFGCDVDILAGKIDCDKADK